ncbi:MAG: hypothetical protein JOZ31_26620, partial [Verrucomicrobia bacterium]|nr:hypothetical protein [Verrucomicrobiota bacterium]
TRALSVAKSGVQELRSSGVQEFRSSGVQEFRSSGVQEFRSSGVQEFRMVPAGKRQAKLTSVGCVQDPSALSLAGS